MRWKEGALISLPGNNFSDCLNSMDFPSRCRDALALWTGRLRSTAELGIAMKAPDTVLENIE